MSNKIREYLQFSNFIKFHLSRCFLRRCPIKKPTPDTNFVRRSVDHLLIIDRASGNINRRGGVKFDKFGDETTMFETKAIIPSHPWKMIRREGGRRTETDVRGSWKRQFRGTHFEHSFSPPFGNLILSLSPGPGLSRFREWLTITTPFTLHPPPFHLPAWHESKTREASFALPSPGIFPKFLFRDIFGDVRSSIGGTKYYSGQFRGNWKSLQKN